MLFLCLKKWYVPYFQLIYEGYKCFPDLFKIIILILNILIVSSLTVT